MFLITGTSYNLFDIWSYGRHLGTPIQCDLYAIWREGKGIEVSRELGLMFAKNNRGNLHGLKLRGVTVVSILRVLFVSSMYKGLFRN